MYCGGSFAEGMEQSIDLLRLMEVLNMSTHGEALKRNMSSGKLMPCDAQFE